MMRLQLNRRDLRRMIRALVPFVVILLMICGFAGMSRSVTAGESLANTESDPLCVKSGSLVICGGGVLPGKLIERFVELGGGPRARVVIVTSASMVADSDPHSRLSGWYDRLCDNQIASLDIVHTRSRAEADNPDFSKVLETATAVWFIGGNQNWLSESYLGTKTEERLHAVLARSGVIGGTSAGAAIMSRHMIADGKTEPFLSTGLGFLPGTIVDQHFRKRNRQERLMRAIQLRPGTVGIGIDEGTALVVQGRTLEVIGESDVSLCLAPSPNRPARVESLAVGKRADLVTLRRAASARAETMKVASGFKTPDVQNGTLVIAGGGPTPKEVVDTFLEAAGGKDAPIVVVSNALGEIPPEQKDVCGWLSAAGARNVKMLHAKSGENLSDPALIALLTEARGVWFTGGRQWRLVDAYLDTNVVALFHDVLRRGGVIGGTSAGATIQGEYLVRGNPLGNEEMMTEGYDRGFCFLPGVAIDQHFTQRERLKDLAKLKKAHPELIGLGVDESTALIVRGSTMQVVGQHHVTVFDRQSDAPAETPEFAVLKSGERYDLRQHRRMETEAVSAASPTN
jgi:cyanophycinase